MKKISKDLEKIAQTLDLSLFMYKNATDKYNAVAKYLVSNGLDINIYPQGSFRTNTVVRPLKNSVESNYDLDFICKFDKNDKEVRPKEIKKSIGNVLNNSSLYREKVNEDNTCWTIQYSEDSNGIGFNLDIVPAINDESFKQKFNLLYGEDAIKITEKDDITNEYHWKDSNPEGVAKWFEDTNNLFLSKNKIELKESLLNDNKEFFGESCSIEDIPDEYLHTSLQRSIQLIKRHRDYYYELTKQTELKPSSFILLIIVTKLSINYINYDLYDLLNNIVKEIKNNIDSYVKKENGYCLLNPIDSSDNILKDWTDENYDEFCKWIIRLEQDICNLNNAKSIEYEASLKMMFGDNCVKSVLLGNSESKALIIEKGIKPWIK